MAASLQDINARSPVPTNQELTDAFSAFKNELARFVERDSGAQAYLRRMSLLYGFDEKGNYLDERGRPLDISLVDAVNAGTQPAAGAVLGRANEAYTSARRAAEVGRATPVTATHQTGFESPEQEPFGVTMGSSMQKEYRTEAEQTPWVESAGLERPEAATEAEGESSPSARATPSLEDVSRPKTAAVRPATPAVMSEAPPSASVAPEEAASGVSAPLLQQYRSALRDSERTKRQHERVEASLKRNIRKTFFLIIAVALFCAALADILSIADFGWVISWSIPLFTGMMLTRMNGIRNAEQGITEARTSARREIMVLQQRLQRLGTRGIANIGQPGPLSSAKSYVGTYIRDTIAVQIAELIPIVDILPMYLGQVVKMMLNQNSTYRKALVSFRALEAEHRTVQALQRTELQSLQRRMLQERLRSYLAPVQSVVNIGRRVFATA